MQETRHSHNIPFRLAVAQNNEKTNWSFMVFQPPYAMWFSRDPVTCIGGKSRAELARYFIHFPETAVRGLEGLC